MSEREFNQRVDDTLIRIEEAIEASGADIDFETSAGILTLTFESGSKVIINRQSATGELWVAARSGGFHCRWQDDGWVCNTTGETLSALLTRVVSEQAGEALAIAI